MAQTVLTTSEPGRLFLSGWEGVVLRAYPDPATGGAPWTIGVGHTSAAGKPVVVKGMTITRAQAYEILARDLVSFEAWVLKSIKVPMTQAQFEACTSLCFNVGPKNFAASSIVKRMNAGDTFGAGAAFSAWNKAAGKVMTGLVRRRAAERTLFLTGQYGIDVDARVVPDEANGVVLVKGALHPDAIRALQQDLITLGLLPPGEDDGDFGTLTDAAVRRFQAGAHLTVDGRAGPATRAAIAAALTKAKQPIAVAMFPLRAQSIDLPIAA